MWNTLSSPVHRLVNSGRERFKGNEEVKKKKKKKERRRKRRRRRRSVEGRKKRRQRRDATCPMHLVGRGASVSIYGFIREQ